MRYIFALLLTVFGGLLAAPAQAEWRRAVTPHFVIYSEGAAGDLHQIAQRLERFDALLRRMSPTPPRETPVKLDIFMPLNRAAVGALARNQTVAGLYRPTVEGSFAIAPRQAMTRGANPETVLFHEYVHHFMLQNFSSAYPPWFVEGYAELLSTVRFERDGSIILGSFADHRARELSLEFVPLERLLFERPSTLRPVERIGYYGNAWFLAHYLLLDQAREGQLARYLTLLGEGRPPEQAAEQAFNGLTAMAQDFNRYRRARHIPTLTVRPGESAAAPAIAIETLGPGEENLLWQQVRFRFGVRPDDLPGFARQVRARAAEAPRDPAALLLLAETEYLVGDDEAANRAIDAVLALQPETPRALLRRGLIMIRRLEAARSTDAAAWTAARDWIRRANRSAPDDPLILVEYYRAFERQGGRPPRNAALGLARALELVPQDASLRMRYARQLIRERRFREAALVLAPVAYSPHDEASSQAASRLIAAIRTLPEGAEPPQDLPEPPPEGATG